MSEFAVEAPSLLLFAEAAQLLQQSAQDMAVAGLADTDLPKLIPPAIARAEMQLEALDLPRSPQLRVTLQSALALASPEELLAFVLQLVGRSGEPDLEVFLRDAQTTTEAIPIPEALLYIELLSQLRDRLPDAELAEVIQGGGAAIESEVATIGLECEAAATEKGVDLSELRDLTRSLVAERSTEELLEILTSLSEFVGDEMEPAEFETPPAAEEVKVNGPLLFMAISDRLLASDFDIGAERRLDLRTNREKAEAKLAAMQRSDRVGDEDKQKQIIEQVIGDRAPEDLLLMLDDWFGAKEF
ncbi:MAG: hypothetical protein AAGB13_06110 [Cyanobacteria bacterium P01_F01_bin.33]